MSILDYVILAFICMEGANIAVLYFKPSAIVGNGVGVFCGFHQAQEHPHAALFVRYLISWVANAKAIFIVLLLVIVKFATEEVKLYTCIAMVASISLYFVSLHPVISSLDKQGQITPKGYSKALAIMIFSFLIMFSVAIGYYLATQ